MRQIKIKELEKLFDKVIEKLSKEGLNEINLDSDLYRFIPTDEWDSYNDTILDGSLFDDWDSLKMNLKNKERSFTYVDFDRLASILRYVSEKQNPVKN